LQEAADVCGGRGRLWVLNAVLVLVGEESMATHRGDGQIYGWFPRLMSIATAIGAVILERFLHCGSE
jgi:hypothetical protein